MFLAWGMATWSNSRSTATPAAPVLLRQAELSARGGAGEDFDATLPGEWELNPTLFHMLKADHGIDLAKDDILGLLDEDSEPPNATPLFERLVKECSDIAGFSVAPRVVLGNFSYAKLPMVLDLENATDTLLGSELICVIAGDEQARAAIRARHPNVSPNRPDITPPAHEFLVLDADASQSYAINCAMQGADLVVESPPGTGKSQTIANLIADLAARGRRVLFVAEKRAAIDAVLDRLSRVGLADLVLDLHDGTGAKRKLAADLARTLEQIATIGKPDLSAEHEAFTRHRNVLVNRADALHGQRQPWEVSVYDVYAQLPKVPITQPRHIGCLRMSWPGSVPGNTGGPAANLRPTPAWAGCPSTSTPARGVPSSWRTRLPLKMQLLQPSTLSATWRGRAFPAQPCVSAKWSPSAGSVSLKLSRPGSARWPW